MISPFPPPTLSLLCLSAPTKTTVTAAPLFIYTNLKEKSSSKKHLRLTEIEAELKKYPYELVLGERLSAEPFTILWTPPVLRFIRTSRVFGLNRKKSKKRTSTYGCAP